MARPAGLKPFYAVLAVVALVGGGWLWFSARQGGANFAEPIPESAIAAASGFPGYVLGSETAPLEVTEFADFQCPACGGFAVLTMHDVKQRLIATGRVRWRFRDFPLPNHANSRPAHHAAACADEQGRFWEMHDQLFYNQSRWSSERNPGRLFADYARAIGLDVARFDECMGSGRFRPRLEASVRDGERLGITSTPTFIIGRVRYPGSLNYDRLKALIDSVIATQAQ